MVRTRATRAPSAALRREPTRFNPPSSLVPAAPEQDPARQHGALARIGPVRRSDKDRERICRRAWRRRVRTPRRDAGRAEAPWPAWHGEREAPSPSRWSETTSREKRHPYRREADREGQGRAAT